MQGWKVEGLITIHITNDDSMMFQIPNTSIAGLQAHSMGVPWLPILSDGRQEEEISDLENGIKGLTNVNYAFERIVLDTEVIEFPDNLLLQLANLEIDALVVGALRSDYQKTRIERMCEKLGLISYCPLWHHNPEEHMHSLIDHGFDVRIVSVSTDGLGKEWLGQKITQDSLEELTRIAAKYRFNLDGEGGEFETIVVDAPHMSQPIDVSGHSNWKGNRGTWILESARIS
jgi:predicted ATP pyrophosphatase (TIGR00289 family)